MTVIDIILTNNWYDNKREKLFVFYFNLPIKN